MDCPYCGYDGMRMSLHRHLVDEHGGRIEPKGGGDEVEAYVYACPDCDDETRISPGTIEDGETLAEFEREIRTLAFDSLLDHLEEEHGY